MSNACFGKTMENKRNRKNIQFVSDQAKASKLTSKPNFKSFQIISDNLCCAYFSVPNIKWDKPTPVGAAILDLSKLALYNFHYNEMRPRYGTRICVTYKDTDSLLYRVETDDLYKDMEEFKHLLDLSDYPTSHPLFDPTNKKVPLTMTDELNGAVLEETYSIKFVSGVKQSAKGVQKVVKKTLHHEKYLQCLQTGVSSRAPMTRIHSLNHQIQVTTTNKTALSCFDDKRFILDNGIDTLPYGHYALGQDPPTPFTACSTDLSSDTDDDDVDQTSLSTDEEQSLNEFKKLTPLDAESASRASTSSFGCQFLTFLNNTNETNLICEFVLASPDPGFFPRDFDQNEPTLNWSDLSDLNEEVDSEKECGTGNPFIDDEAIEDKMIRESDDENYLLEALPAKRSRLIVPYSDSD